MSLQNIMWTALPKGLNAAGDHLKLSVLVSPRLVTNNGVDGTLAEFPDFLDWPKEAGALNFRVDFQSGPSFTVQAVTEPGYPAPDSATWTALFLENTPVRSYAFDDRSDLPVRSFPTRQVLSFLIQQYSTFAVQTPSNKPSLAQLGFEPFVHSIGSFGDIVIGPDYARGGDDQLNKFLGSPLKAVPGNFGDSRLHFYQVRKMHEFLCRVQYDGNGHRLPLPPQKPPDVDFHNAVASMGQYPQLMRALGLAIDLEVPTHGVPTASNVRVTPNLEGTPPMTPWTAYQIDTRAKSFLPAPAADSDVSNGMLSLTYPDHYDEGSGTPEFKDDGTERVLTVHLPKAEVVTVALSCYLTDDPTSNPPNVLSTMKIWSWIVGANPPNLSDLQQLALDGGHWMITPPKLLTLVHAVQQPLIEPQFQHLTATRQLGETFASLTDEFPMSGKSTIKVDIEATWQEPIDDPKDTTNAQPVIHNGSGHAFALDLATSDTVLVIDQFAGNKHEFHDTKHRNVTYTAVATTRFREYFPPSITNNQDNITRKSQPLTISIPSSARPTAPHPLYVIPSFG